MKLVLLSDTHLDVVNPVARLDDVGETGKRKMGFVLQWAGEHGARILHAGDFSVKPRSWKLLAETMDLFGQHDVPFSTVFGQHDTYMYSEETRDATTLGILAKAGYVHILGPKPLILGYETTLNAEEKSKTAVYGCHYGQDIPDAKGTDDFFNILIIHAPIAAESPYHTAEYLDAGKFLRDHKLYDLILCGDIHQKFHLTRKAGGFTRHIVNTGPMIRREATLYNYQHHPGFYVWDTETEELSWVEIPHEPAERVLTRDHLEFKQEAEAVLDEFIQSVKTDAVAQGVSFMDNLRTFLKTNKVEMGVVNVLANIIGEEKFYGREK